MLMPIMKNLCNRIGSEARRRHELKNTGKAIQVNDVNGLLHTIWNCKYHYVFAPKLRRKVIFGEKGREIEEMLRTLCSWRKTEQESS